MQIQNASSFKRSGCVTFRKEKPPPNQKQKTKQRSEKKSWAAATPAFATPDLPWCERREQEQREQEWLHQRGGCDGRGASDGAAAAAKARCALCRRRRRLRRRLTTSNRAAFTRLATALPEREPAPRNIYGAPYPSAVAESPRAEWSCDGRALPAWPRLPVRPASCRSLRACRSDPARRRRLGEF
uniref:uncharacterized protein LOC103795880 n=1 Tax=Callithrix jacchus TaxID=9483 RepID=UPI0023DD2555|nr:uncharacterized protein LOC103795880 [Callithrix jacchus]